VLLAYVDSKSLLLAWQSRTSFDAFRSQSLNQRNYSVVIANLRLLQGALLLTASAGWTGKENVDQGRVGNVHPSFEHGSCQPRLASPEIGFKLEFFA
jgi:hypothetical protein